MVASPIVRAIASFHCFYNFLNFIIALKYKSFLTNFLSHGSGGHGYGWQDRSEDPSAKG